MADSQGFWSYVHADDDAEHGRIAQLARDVAGQFQMMTGESIELFLDQDAILWGEAWKAKVDSSLASVAFFIPVLTPRYFDSVECRREVQLFARKATKLGVRELLLPVLYVNVPSLHLEDTADELVDLIRGFQWEDWTDLRFREVGSEDYRRAVARLASRLVEANRQAETAPAGVDLLAIHPDDESTDDSPGVIDQLANAEKALPKWKETAESIASHITSIGAIVGEGTAEMNAGDKQGRGFAGRQLVVRRVARLLDEPVQGVWSSANDFVSQLHDVDDGLRIIIERAPTEVHEDPSSKTAFCGFFESVRQLSASTHEALESTKGMIESMAPIEKMSRDLRPVLRRLRQGLTVMIEAGQVSDEWLHLIESSGIECEER